MLKQTILSLLLAAPVVVLAMPHEECGDAKRDCTGCHSLSVGEANALLAGTADVRSVQASPVAGLFEVLVERNGKQAIAYVDYGKKHVISGPIFDIATKNVVREQAPAPEKGPSPIDINSIPVAHSIVMGNPEGKKKLFVFTDPECPYCEKLHRELVKLMYMEPDVAIYVKLYPLAMHPGSYDKARVILGRNSPYLLDKAFAGEPLPVPGPNDSAQPVEETVRLVRSLGITATPTLVLPDGRIMPGYKEAAAIKELLKHK